MWRVSIYESLLQNGWVIVGGNDVGLARPPSMVLVVHVVHLTIMLIF